MECPKRGPVMATHQPSSPFTRPSWNQNPLIPFNDQTLRPPFLQQAQRFHYPPPSMMGRIATIEPSQDYVSSSEDTDSSSLPKAVIVDKVMSFFVQWLDRRLGVPPSTPITVPSAKKRFFALATAAGPEKERTSTSDLAERLRIQNRIAQRSYRKKLTRRLRRAGGSSGTAAGSTALPGGSHSSSSQPATGHGSTAGAKRAGGGGQSDPDSGSADGDDKRRGKRPRLDAQNDGNERAKLACPYYKHNARKYKQQRPCCRPGWDFVHRIKEHLYRKHALPRYSCPRCCERFEAEDELSTHARAPEPCGVREPELHDGFTQAQEKRLRSRKKDRAAGVEDLTEPQKWRQMYRILFPDVREEEIPSPYYEDNDLNKGELEGFEDYLRRELPPLVRRQLEQEVDRELNFVEEGLKRRVINMVQGLQLTLLQSYRKLEESEAAGPAPAASVNLAPGLNDESSSENSLLLDQGDLVAQVASQPPEPMELGAGPFDGLCAWDDIQSYPYMVADDFDFLGSSGSLADYYPMLASDSGYTSGGSDVDKPDSSVPEDPSDYAGVWVPPGATAGSSGDRYISLNTDDSMVPSGPSPMEPISGFLRPNLLPFNPTDQNLPCNTLSVENLPMDTFEEELKGIFSNQRGYKRICLRTKQSGPMCLVEFEDVSFATKALHDLYGYKLHNGAGGGIRLSFSKKPLGVRSSPG
ncbi:hypothetical protein RB594_003946 [Gaeumannomyces avenae]